MFTQQITDVTNSQAGLTQAGAAAQNVADGVGAIGDNTLTGAAGTIAYVMRVFAHSLTDH